MKKESPKKQKDQIDEHNAPTEPLPDISPVLFPPTDQSGSMSGGGRTMQSPFSPSQDLQQPPNIYPYLPNPSGNVPRSPYSPSWSGPASGTNYAGWPATVSAPGNTKNQPTRRRWFLPACVGLFFFCVQLLLIVRFGVRVLNLSSDIAWVSVVTNVSAIFVLPFQVLWYQIPVFGPLVPTNVEVYTLAAILIYGVLSRLLVGILKVLLKSR